MKFTDINGVERDYDVWYPFEEPWPFMSHGLAVLPVNPPEGYALQLLFPEDFVCWWHPWTKNRSQATHWRLKSPSDWYEI
jgi:hypothetical protein